MVVVTFIAYVFDSDDDDGGGDDGGCGGGSSNGGGGDDDGDDDDDYCHLDNIEVPCLKLTIPRLLLHTAYITPHKITTAKMAAKATVIV